MVLILLLYSQTALAGKSEVEHYAVSADMQVPFSEAVRDGYMLYLGSSGLALGARTEIECMATVQ